MLMTNTLQKQIAIMVPMLDILLLILFQGGNNLTDLTPKTVWVGKLGTFLSLGRFTIT